MPSCALFLLESEDPIYAVLQCNFSRGRIIGLRPVHDRAEQRLRMDGRSESL